MIPVMSVHGVIDWKVLRAKRNSDPRGTNTNQFKRFVRQCLVPHLRPYPQPHYVIVMDRASIHFRPDVIELIERTGARVMPLAPYCPWDNAVEHMHAWVKSWLKRHYDWVERVGPICAISASFECLPDGYARRTIEHNGY